MKLRNLLVLGSMAIMGAAFTSCSKENLFDNEAAIEKQKAEYEANFVKKFGAIDPNQSWDFSSMTPSTSMVSTTRALTRGDGDSYNADATEGQILIQKATIDWMSENMKAGKNNVKKGKPFFLQVPQNSFTIVPIFQGTASYFWQLWMHVDGITEDKLIWSKGEKITYRTSETSTNWASPGTSNAGMNNAFEVKAPTYEFANLPVNANMYFYLKVWNSYSDYKKNTMNPRVLTSLDQMMLALIDCPRPTNVPEGNTVSIIGCEDNKSGDYDYEDLVFMMYGNPAPPIQHVDEVIVGTTKRYMMEDLGATDDFDFNDVVVDVTTDRVKKKIFYDIDANGSWTFNHEEIIEHLPQEAIVRAAGGTLDFTLTIGNTTWTKSAKFPNYQEMLNTGWQGSAISYGAELDKFEVSGYDPSSNNISVTVQGRGGSGDVMVITFPKKGKAPMIIALDASNNWMDERSSVPTGWFTTE
ncbi:MAG: hypothetical protein K6F74_08105 [Prevotella sp.]|nr:hypothetical protein [Prevotella sp.]